MEQSDLINLAENFLECYRQLLTIDPFFRIKLETSSGDFISECVKDGAPLSWVVKLNPSRHNDEIDVRYSVVESLVRILFYTMDVADPAKIVEAREGLMSRLTAAFSNLLPTEMPTVEEQDENSD